MKKGNLQKPSKKLLPLSNSTPHKTAALSPFVRRFIKRVQNTVARYSLWKKGDTFIVAVSGGPDSLCLLDVLVLLSQKYHFTLHIAHVNYALRGKESLADEKRVIARAKHYALPFSVLHPRKKNASPSEETLRALRYAFFEKLRLRKKYTAIVVAHHADDQAETLLLRLLRGTGLAGLAAMRPKNNVLIRPLLETSRKDILRYLKERGITYGTDSTNTDTRFLRNKIRHILLPLLEEQFQPQIKKLLAHTAHTLAEDFAQLEKQLSPAHTFSPPWKRRELLALPENTLRHQLRTFLKTVYGGKNPPRGIVDTIIKALQSKKSKVQTLSFHGLKLECKGDTVRLLNFPKLRKRRQ